jgi:hypothetical protein
VMSSVGEQMFTEIIRCLGSSLWRSAQAAILFSSHCFSVKSHQGHPAPIT